MTHTRNNNHGNRIDCIEVLRAFAVLFVVFHHINGSLIKFTSPIIIRFYDYFNGWVGVDLFFAISGFVIARSLMPQLPAGIERPAFWRTSLSFWIRRAYRLLPSSWIWLLVILTCSVFYNDSGVFGSFRTNFAATLAGIFNVANVRFAHVFGNHFYGASFVYWSLSLEEQFYLLFPFAILLFRRWLPPLFAIGVALQFFIQRSLLLMAFRTDAILLGILLALWTRTESYRLFEPAPLKKSPVTALGVLALLLTGLVCMPSAELRIVPQPIGMVALISTLLVWLASYDRGYILSFSPLRKLLCWVGSRSYAIYLIHIPLFFGVRETLHRANIQSPEPGSCPDHRAGGLVFLKRLELQIFGNTLAQEGGCIRRPNQKRRWERAIGGKPLAAGRRKR